MYSYPPAIAFEINQRSAEKLEPLAGDEFEYRAVICEWERPARPLSQEEQELVKLDTVARPPKVGSVVNVRMCRGGILLKTGQNEDVPVVFPPGTFTDTTRPSMVLLLDSWPSPELALSFETAELARRFVKQVFDVCQAVTKSMLAEYKSALGESTWQELPVLACPPQCLSQTMPGEYICGLNAVVTSSVSSEFPVVTTSALSKTCRRREEVSLCAAWVELVIDSEELFIRILSSPVQGGCLVQAIFPLEESMARPSRQAESGCAIYFGRTVTFESPEIAAAWLELCFAAATEERNPSAVEAAKQRLVDLCIVAKQEGGRQDTRSFVPALAQTPMAFERVPGAKLDLLHGQGGDDADSDSDGEQQERTCQRGPPSLQH